MLVVSVLIGIAPTAAASARTGWQRVPSPTVLTRNGSLTAVSCPVGGSCVAVGVGTRADGASGAVVQRRTTSGWQIESTPLDRGFGPLEVVDCPTARVCVALGRFTDPTVLVRIGAVRWDGTAWSELPTAGLPTGPNTSLSAVSCATAVVCTVVGAHAVSGKSGISPFVAQWRGGVWRMLSTPPALGVAPAPTRIAGLSCPAVSSCYATGSSSTSTAASSAVAVVWHWDGTSWTVVWQDALAVQGAVGIDIDCVTSTHCVALAHIQRRVQTTAVVVLDNGTVGLTVLAQSGSGDYTRVACVDAVHCEAVGSGGAIRTAAVRSGWEPSALPVPVADVACARVDDCTAVGSGPTSPSDLIVVSHAAHTDGAGWTEETTDDPVGYLHDDLRLLGCHDGNNCLALGSAAGGVLHADRWDGTTWSAVADPPTGFTPVAVACGGTTDCLVSGSMSGRAVSAHWSAGVWSVDPLAPSGESGESGVTAGKISCPTRTWCAATTSSNHAPLQVWNGHTWRVDTTFPTGSDTGTTTGLGAIACPAVAVCAVTGTQAAPGAATTARVFTRDAVGWAATPAYVATDEHIGLTDVSCASATACVAVGTSGVFDAPAVSLTGGTAGGWTARTVPRGTLGGLEDVSCGAPTSCHARGDGSPAGARIFVGDGTTWSPDPGPADAPGTGVYDLACPSPTRCLAVGEDPNGTFALVWRGP